MGNLVWILATAIECIHHAIHILKIHAVKDVETCAVHVISRPRITFVLRKENADNFVPELMDGGTKLAGVVARLDWDVTNIIGTRLKSASLEEYLEQFN